MNDSTAYCTISLTHSHDCPYHLLSQVQAMAESLTQPLKSSSQEEGHNVHWMSDTTQPSTYKPPFRSSRGPPLARHYQEFDDQDSQGVLPIPDTCPFCLSL